MYGQRVASAECMCSVWHVPASAVAPGIRHTPRHTEEAGVQGPAAADAVGPALAPLLSALRGAPTGLSLVPLHAAPV